MDKHSKGLLIPKEIRSPTNQKDPISKFRREKKCF